MKKFKKIYVLIILLFLVCLTFVVYNNIINQNATSVTLTMTEWTSSHWFTPEEHPVPITTSQVVTRGDVVTIAGLSSEGTIRIQRITDGYVVIRVTSTGISHDPRMSLPRWGQTFEIPYGEVFRLETMAMSTVVGWSLVFRNE